MKTPDDRRYTRDHSWVKKTNSVLVVGVTDYAQDALGEVVHVQLPKVGDKFVGGASCCEVESSKSVSDVYVPLSGTITRVNEILESQPGFINSDPYENGWIFEMTLDANATFESLFDASTYENFVEGR